MFEMQFFLGFPIDELFQKRLDSVDAALVGHYVNGSRDYLSEVQHLDMKFFGKRVDAPLSLSELELLEANVYSLLKKIVPDYLYEEVSLYLFPVDQAKQ